jgi:hypothetical protein
LVDVVGPATTTGHGVKVSDFFGLEMTLHCSPKKAFGTSGPPELPESPSTLLECLKKGVETNARLKSQEPWKLYFPEEVVVVATFKAMEERGCLLSAAGQKEHNRAIKSELCAANGAEQRDSLLKHLVDGKGQPHQKGSGTFMGAATGAGWPKGALEEVVLSPEDVLEALELIAPSHGR